MLYEAPRTFNGPDLLYHKFSTMAELNALNQARRTRVFPTPRKVNGTIRLKDGRTLGRGLGRLYAVSPRINYNSKSAPYLSGRRRGGLGNFITDAIGAVTGTVTGTVSSVASSVQPIEQLLQNNPSLLNLVKSYIPTASNPTPVTVVAKPVVVAPTSTLGVSNKVWLVGAAGAGALVLAKLLGRR